MSQQEDECLTRLFFQKYKPEKVIGQGSFGKIYSAVNIVDKKKYALKMVNQILIYI
jgi:serine/threonine protein kinase